MAEGESHALVVGVADERFALPALAVDRIIRAVRLTRLPEVPDGIEGVLNLHGAPVPVVDLRCRFALPKRPIQPSDVLVVMRGQRRTWALRADAALVLVTLSAEQLVPRANVTSRGVLARGIVCLPDGLIFFTSPDDFYDDAEDARIASALAASAPSADGDVR